MSDAAPKIVQNILAGRAGGVNDLMKLYQQDVVDYATALIPDRGDPFRKMLEDLFVDFVVQCRAFRNCETNREMLDGLLQSMIHTVRTRYPKVLGAEAAPERVNEKLSFDQILQRTEMDSAELTKSISDGAIRAWRENNKMVFKAEDVPGLGSVKRLGSYHIAARERELLALYFRFHVTEEKLAVWMDSTVSKITNEIETASSVLINAGVVKEQFA